jgi:hypothetical protein
VLSNEKCCGRTTIPSLQPSSQRQWVSQDTGPVSSCSKLHTALFENYSGNDMSAVVKRGHGQRNGLSASHRPVNTHARPPIHLIKFISVPKVSTTVPAKRVWLLGCNYKYKTLVTPPNGNDELYCKFISCKPIIKSRTFIEIRQRKFSDYGGTNKMFRKCGQVRMYENNSDKSTTMVVHVTKLQYTNKLNICNTILAQWTYSGKHIIKLEPFTA